MRFAGGFGRGTVRGVILYRLVWGLGGTEAEVDAPLISTGAGASADVLSMPPS